MLHSRRWVDVAALCLLALVACSREAPRDESTFRGVYVSPAVEKPDFTFTDFNGEPFNFRLKTANTVPLLFFGYTHCPDVCPLHAANVAAVLKQMPFEEREKIRFIFVTTDPDRDTPEGLREWRGAFYPSFSGLRAPADELSRIQRELRVAPARKEYPPGADSASYLVGHAAQVIAFGLDGLARTEYPMGVRQEDWARDLPRLARGEIPKSPSQPATPEQLGLKPSSEAPAGPAITVSVAVMPAPATTTEAAVYLVFQNAGADDTLTTVFSPAATGAMIHTSEASGGQQVMRMLASLPVAKGETVAMAPGRTHIMLTGLSRRPEVGESFPLQLRFAKFGDLVVAPVVVSYAELEGALRK